jgi:hypothetical protein
VRNRLVVAGAIAAAVLGVPVGLVVALPPVPQVHGPRPALMVAGIVAVAVVSGLVLRHRRTAARWAAWFAVPAIGLGALWTWQPQSSFGWFAYAPLSSVVVQGSPGADVLLPALLLLLGTLASTGVVTLLGDESPVRVLAVVAVALTGPLWVPARPRVLGSGALLPSESPSATAALVRTAALLLVLALSGAVLAARRPAPARSAAFALPAVGLSWVWWRTQAGSVVGIAAPGDAPLPRFADRLPWLVVPSVATVLVIVLWVLTVLGARELLARCRPPDVIPVSSSGR